MENHPEEKPRKILVIDDDPFTRDIFRLALEKAGFRVSAAENGELGIQAVEADKPDVIMLDLMMPVLDGFGTLERLKTNENTRAIPVIVLSSMRQDEDIKRAMKSGASAYLKKGQAVPSDIPAKAREVMGLPPLEE